VRSAAITVVPAAKKAVEHDLAARRAVEDRVGIHRHRLHRRV
jgi:hypothetical protein